MCALNYSINTEPRGEQSQMRPCDDEFCVLPSMPTGVRFPESKPRFANFFICHAKYSPRALPSVRQPEQRAPKTPTHTLGMYSGASLEFAPRRPISREPSHLVKRCSRHQQTVCVCFLAKGKINSIEARCSCVCLCKGDAGPWHGVVQNAR